MVLTRTPLRSLGLVVAIAVGSALAALFTYVFGWEVLTVGDVADVPTGFRFRCSRRFGDLGVPGAAGALARVRRPRAGRRRRGGRSERRRQAGRRLAQLHRPGRRQHRRRGVPGHAGRRLDVGVGAHRRRGRTHAPRAVHRGDRDGARDPRRVGRRRRSSRCRPSRGCSSSSACRRSSPRGSSRSRRRARCRRPSWRSRSCSRCIIPLQFAVLVGVGLGIILFVAQQSNRLRVRQLEFHDDGPAARDRPGAIVPPHDVVVLQPYGNLSYASAPVLRGAAAEGRRPTSRGSVVILRLRGIDELGLSFGRGARPLPRRPRTARLHAVARDRRRADRRPARGGRPARPPRTRPRVRELGVGRRGRAPCAPRCQDWVRARR